MSTIVLEQTPKTTLKRLPKRGAYDRETIYSILDEALICHVGFVVDGAPVVIPTIHWREGDTLYVHGSAASRMLRSLREGVDACVTVTLLDGLVLARSTFHHSMNYRSVVVFGKAREVTDREEKLRALDALVEHVVRGRSAEARGPNESELRATLVLALPLEEASAKIRTGPPVDDDADYGLAFWAGELPIRTSFLPAVPDPRLETAIPVPEHVSGYRRPGEPPTV